jgi:hypothetical protein
LPIDTVDINLYSSRIPVWRIQPDTSLYQTKRQGRKRELRAEARKGNELVN